ncbi:MAG: hypothetical protein HOM58_18950 [Rhodospirillaceae bacterium]|jgi:hypothetical protein|nr:hypothetical protein [Rhodospirillaceae bacterium]MBT5457186.1 hypothetical protein [Rhodospirillaceae bacterium]
MEQSQPPTKNRLLFDFLACLLIILSHFANYIFYAGYARIFPDILVVLTLLGIVALGLTALLQIPSRIFRALIFAILITIVISDALYEFGVAEISTRLVALAATLLIVLALAFLLRDHANKVLMGAFLAMLCSTIAIAAFSSKDRASQTAAIPNKGDNALPIVVHLILDEHMGAAGMTKALTGGEAMGRRMREFYKRAGFRLFSHAYSQYAETAQSLTSAMNSDNDRFGANHMTQRRYGFSLKNNAYLKAFSDLNYRINIVQSNYIDFCQTQQIRVANCVTYKPDNLRSPEIAGLPLAERVKLILNMYYSSLTLIKLIKYTETLDERRSWPGPVLLSAAKAIGAQLWHGRVGPLAVATSFDQLVTDISRAKGGSLFFAHLLMPHYPYVYGPDCALRSPVSSWSQKHLPDGTNSSASRQKHYAEYFDQTRCVMRKLQRLFDTMKRAGTFKKSIIVIHGDHGARISRASQLGAAPSMADYIDRFSTLFAIKAPNIVPGTDARMVSLLQLLKFATSRDARSLSAKAVPTVYGYDRKRGYSATVLPDFPGRAR